MATGSVHPDQRKRTIEALERRFAVAKAELLQQQNKGKTTSIEKNLQENFGVKSASSTNPTDSSANFSHCAAKKDVEENGPEYSALAQPINENLLMTNVEQLSFGKGNVVDKILHDLLRSGDSAQKYMQGSRSMKVDNWILLDTYVQGRGVSSGSRIRALSSHSKRSKKHMSMKKLKKCGSFNLPKDLQKFDLFSPMHEMWESYMMQLLKATGKNQLAQCLLSADLHGAFILVAECRITTFTGVSGIMVRETAETFGVITRDDKFQVVPKKVSVFIFQVDCWKITLQGDKLTSRNLGL